VLTKSKVSIEPWTLSSEGSQSMYGKSQDRESQKLSVVNLNNSIEKQERKHYNMPVNRANLFKRLRKSKHVVTRNNSNESLEVKKMIALPSK
jgi:hypothetical protein